MHAKQGDLTPGMVLSRDLNALGGLMLLSAEHILDERMIQKIRELEMPAGSLLTFFIKAD